MWRILSHCVQHLKKLDYLCRYRKAIRTWTCSPYAMTEAKGTPAFGKSFYYIQSDEVQENIVDI